MLNIGVSTRDITPDHPVWMDGYGNRDHTSEGTYGPLSARALAFVQGESAAVVLVADVLNFDHEQERRFKASVAQATGLPAEAVVLCATHTHCGPKMTDILIPGVVDGPFLSQLEEAFVATAKDSLAGAQPAGAAFSRARSAFGISRRLPDGEGGVRFHANPEGMIDRDLDTYWFTGADGRPLASLSVYGCHPTSRAGYLLGPDYPGFLRAGIEREWGGTALFLTGCGGNIRPAFLDENGRFRSAEIPQIEAAGNAMAAEALAGRARAHALDAPAPRATSGSILLPQSEPPDRSALLTTFEKSTGEGREWAKRMLALLDDGPLPRAVPFTLQTLSLDSRHALVFLAGEVVTEVGMLIKQAYPGQVISVPAYSNGMVGYVPSRSIYPQGGYEVLGSYQFYLQPAPFTPDVEDVILAEARRQLG